MIRAAHTLYAVAIVAIGLSGGALAQRIGGPKIDGNDPTMTAVGKRLYAAHCAACHGKNLEGQPNWRERLPDGGLRAPPHDKDGHTWHHDDALLFKYTKLGGKKLFGDRIKSNMPGFGGALNDTQIVAVLAYIKSRWPKEIRERQAMIDRMRRNR